MLLALWQFRASWLNQKFFKMDPNPETWKSDALPEIDCPILFKQNIEIKSVKDYSQS